MRWFATTQHAFMNKLAALLLATLLSANAAACPITAELVQRYGISFSGFDKELPAATPPSGRDGESFVRLPIREKVWVSDGFRHAVLLDRAARKAWIVRYGGLSGAEAWFGPVDAGNAPLDDCRARPQAPAEARIEPAALGKQ